jgi:hypothetical protein
VAPALRPLRCSGRRDGDLVLTAFSVRLVLGYKPQHCEKEKEEHQGETDDERLAWRHRPAAAERITYLSFEPSLKVKTPARKNPDQSMEGMRELYQVRADSLLRSRYTNEETGNLSE